MKFKHILLKTGQTFELPNKSIKNVHVVQSVLGTPPNNDKGQPQYRILVMWDDKQ